MNDFKVIPAQKHHLSVCENILNSATQKLLDKGVMQWEYPWDKNEILSYIENGQFYIACSGDNVIGCVGIRDFTANHFNPQDKTGVYMYHLAVHPDCSGKGYGEALCRWLQRWRKENRRAMYFDCWRGNRALIGFYTKNGFTPLGKFPEDDYFVYAFKADKE